MGHFLQHTQLHLPQGAPPPFSRWRGMARGGGMLSEVDDLQGEDGLQSQASLLHNSSSESQAHMGHS